MADPSSRPTPPGVGGVKSPAGSEEKKSHLYYGKITQTCDAAAAAVLEDGPIGSNTSPTAAGAAGTAATTAASEAAEAAVAAAEENNQHAERLKAFQMQQTATSFKTVAPTIDAEVRDALR